MRPRRGALRSRCGSRPRRRDDRPSRRRPRRARARRRRETSPRCSPRTSPVSVAAPVASLTGRPRARSRRPARERPWRRCVGSCTGSPFDERSVARAEIFDPQCSVTVERASVYLRDERVERERHGAACRRVPRVISSSTANAAPASAAGSTNTRRHCLRRFAPGVRRAARGGRDDRLPRPACPAARARRPRRLGRGTGRAPRGGRTSGT